MSMRKVLVFFLILITLIIPLIQLAIGFYYINQGNLCPLENDLTLLMAIGGVFQLIFFASAFGLIFSITPVEYKLSPKTGKAANRWSQMLIAGVTTILGLCAMTFFVLLNIRIFANYNRVQSTNSNLSTYCLKTIFSGAFGLIIGTYIGYVFFFLVAMIFFFGIGVQRDE